MNIQELRERRQNNKGLASLPEFSKPSEFKKPPENKWSPDFNHIKISHYEHGIGPDYECIELLHRIKEKDAKYLSIIKYMHNHKGGIYAFVEKNTCRNVYYDIFNILVNESGGSCVYIRDFCSHHPNFEHVVENLVRFIRSEAEWVAEYAYCSTTMKRYFEGVMQNNYIKEPKYMTPEEFISNNNLPIGCGSFNKTAGKYSELLGLEVKSGRLKYNDYFHEQILSIIYKTKL